MNHSLFTVKKLLAAVLMASGSCLAADDASGSAKTEVEMPSISVSVSATTNGVPQVLSLVGELPGAGKSQNPVVWIGVGTEPVSPVLTSQFSLPEGTGLVVVHVAPESPAAKAGVQVNDILLRLNDQILINADQLKTLAATHKEGDAVKLKLLRKGQEMELTVTLAKKTGNDWAINNSAVLVFPSKNGQFQLNQLGNLQLKLQDLVKSNVDAGAIAEKLANEIQSGVAKHPQHFASPAQGAPVPAANNNNPHVKVSSSHSASFSSVLSDDTGTYVISSNNGRTHLKATDSAGKSLFEGDIQTAEERAKMPAEVLKKIEKMLSFGADGTPSMGGIKIETK